MKSKPVRKYAPPKYPTRLEIAARPALLHRHQPPAGRKFYLSPFEVKVSSHINWHCYQKDGCELGRRQFSVDPDGWLYPCVQFVKGGPASRWCIGHVATDFLHKHYNAAYPVLSMIEDALSSQGKP